MLSYIVRRVLYAFLILLGVSLFTFVLFYASASPQQIARRNISAKNPSPKQINDWLKQHGYDKPLYVQAQKHLTEMFLFRFGQSDTSGEVISDRLRAGVGPSATIATLVFIASL